MCGRKLKMFSVLSVLALLSFCSPCLSFCYADVVLTDQEAQTLLTEIQESKKDLKLLQTQLDDVKKGYEMQKKSYERQLNEAEEKESNLKTAVTATSVSSVIFSVLMVVFIII